MSESKYGRPFSIAYVLMGVGLLAHPARVYSADDSPDIGQSMDSSPSMFSLSGFGTLGVVHSSEHQADFVSNGMQPKGAGFTDNWSATPDSKLGMQLSAQFTEQLSAVVQAVSQYQANGTYKPDLEWANIKYQPTPEFDIRAGRIALPTFMYSDSVNVGYALPYVRIPLENLRATTGGQQRWSRWVIPLQVGGASNSTQVYVGRFNSKTPNGGYYNVLNVFGIVDALEYKALTVHLGYQALRYDLNIPGLSLKDDPQNIESVGVSYDPARWLVLGELIRAQDEAGGLYLSSYIMGGYRFGKFTPYVYHATANRPRAGTDGGLPFLNQDTNSLGLRYDFMRNFDCKLQLDHTKLHGGFNSFFINQQPGFREVGTVNVLSLAVDFVF